MTSRISISNSPSAGRKGKAEIEVRQLYELEDFGDVEAIERFRELEMAGSK